MVAGSSHRGVPSEATPSAFAPAGRWAKARRAQIRQLAPVFAMAIPVTMISSWLIAARMQPVAYSPVRQSVSVLAGYGGRDRWIVTGALLIVSTCYVLTAIGLTELTRRAHIGLVLSGLCALGIAVSPQPAHGSTPRHVALTVLGALTIAIWPLLVAQRAASGWSPMSVRTSAVAAVLFLGLLAWTLVEAQDGTHLGLSERLSSGAQECWPAVVAYALRLRPWR